MKFSVRRASMLSMRNVMLAGCALFSIATLTSINAQNVRISIVSRAPARIRVDARLPSSTNALSFRNNYAGVVGLGERIEIVQAYGDGGASVAVDKLAPGEFRSSQNADRFIYEVNLTEDRRPADLSHISSLNSDYGLLMMADLLPQPTGQTKFLASVAIKVDVPAGWRVASNIREEGSQFLTEDPDTAVFLIGNSLHEKLARAAQTNFAIVSAGEWPFSYSDASKIAGKILEEYSRVTRFQLKRNAVLMLVPYPDDVGPENWAAETRGNVVVLLLGRKARGKRVLSRLGIVLSHELFHLWIPNSLKLEGDYDWFFEGFTLYRALRTDLTLGLISFYDYLETISHVYDAYNSSPDRDRLSLIEASQQRWTTTGSLVYEKGMLVAFIYDLELRRFSDCRTSLNDVYAELFRLPATGQGSANETIIGVLSEREELKTFGRDHIESVAKIDLGTILSPYGIQLGSSAAGATQLILRKDLSKTQRNLLGCIGYPN